MKMIKKITTYVLIFSLIFSLPCFAKIKAVTTVDDSTTQTENSQEEKKVEETAKKQEEVKEETKEVTKPETQKSTTANNTDTQSTQNKVDVTKTAEYQALLAQIQALQAQQALQQQQAIQQALEAQAIEQANKGTGDQAGYWTREVGYWVFYDYQGNKIKDRFLVWNEKTYYLDQMGNMATGWKFISHAWYLFGKNGEMIKGWWDDGNNNWYYLDPETGKMADSDRYIDGSIEHFGSNGLWIKDVNSYQQAELAAYVKNMVSYIENKSDLKKVKPTSELKDQINKVIEGLPRSVLSQLVANAKNIFICVNQQQKKEYMRSVSYKDEDGNRDYEYLPYTTSKYDIYVDGMNPYLLYYGIGEWLSRTLKYQGNYLYSTPVWKLISKPRSEDLDELISLSGMYDLTFYTADALASCGCAIGWYLIDPMVLKEANTSAYRFVAQFIDITTGSPLIDQ